MAQDRLLKKCQPLSIQSALNAAAKHKERQTPLTLFFESSWYFARYTCVDQRKAILDERANYWLPVDQYIGGIEHAILASLVLSFFYKALAR